MSTTTQEERLARRVDDLTANDPQFAAARPDPAVAAALERPGLRLPKIIQTNTRNNLVIPYYLKEGTLVPLISAAS